MKRRLLYLRAAIAALAIFLCVTAGGVRSAQAIDVLDQSQELANISFSQPFTGEEQTFRPAYNNVSAIGVWVFGSGTVTVQLFDASCGALIGAGTTTASGNGWVKVSFAAPVRVTPEAQYAFHVDGTMLAYGGGNPDPYPRGCACFDCTPMAWPFDFAFRTYADDAILPVTTSVWSQVKRIYR